MSARGGADPRVEPDEEAEEVWGYGVGEEVVDVGVFARWGVAGGCSLEGFDG